MKIDIPISVSILILLTLSVFILNSIAPFVFPFYFIYIGLALAAYLIFSQISFDIISLFSKQLYIFSIVFLIIPLLIGQVTRGAVRWIPIGELTIQPAEIVRPFLFLFFANFILSKKMDLKRFIQILLLLAIPLFLIIVQPSLGVSVLTFIGFVGILISSGINRKYIFYPGAIMILAIPIIWMILASYQKTRIISFLSPASDPSGAGYNSLQSMISVGSGKLTGRGLGEGVGTQLLFLPERHTDFIFASIAEELGFVGAFLLITVIFFMLLRVVGIMEKAQNPIARTFISGVFLSFLFQILIHIGMNVGLFPITGLPLPLVSAGGSSLLATMISLGMVVGAKR